MADEGEGSASAATLEVPDWVPETVRAMAEFSYTELQTRGRREEARVVRRLATNGRTRTAWDTLRLKRRSGPGFCAPLGQTTRSLLMPKLPASR